MPKEVARVLQGKNILVFRAMLKESGHEDKQLIGDFTTGFRVTGDLGYSNVFEDRPDAKEGKKVEWLRGKALEVRSALIESLLHVRAQDPHIQSEVCKATAEEVQLGWASGPWTVRQLAPQSWTTKVVAPAVLAVPLCYDLTGQVG